MNQEQRDNSGNNGNEKFYRLALSLLKEMYLKPQGIELDCLEEQQIEVLIFGLFLPVAAAWAFILKRRLASWMKCG